VCMRFLCLDVCVAPVPVSFFHVNVLIQNSPQRFHQINSSAVIKSISITNLQLVHTGASDSSAHVQLRMLASPICVSLRSTIVALYGVPHTFDNSLLVVLDTGCVFHACQQRQCGFTAGSRHLCTLLWFFDN